MRTHKLVLCVLLAAVAVAHPVAQAPRVWTPQELFARNIGTREQQDRQFPPHRVIGNIYDVVIIGSMGVNPGTRLVNNASNPAIADEYVQGFKVMHALPCDVPLGSHPDMYNMAEKHAKLGDGRPNPFIDPQGYKAEIDLVERTFRSVFDDQKKAAAQ